MIITSSTNKQLYTLHSMVACNAKQPSQQTTSFRATAYRCSCIPFYGTAKPGSRMPFEMYPKNIIQDNTADKAGLAVAFSDSKKQSARRMGYAGNYKATVLKNIADEAFTRNNYLVRVCNHSPTRLPEKFV